MKPELPHPSVYIKEELRARRWSRQDLAIRMVAAAHVDEIALNILALDMYLGIGAKTPNLRISDDLARDLAAAFGTSTALFLNLERSWLERQEERAAKS